MSTRGDEQRGDEQRGDERGDERRPKPSLADSGHPDPTGRPDRWSRA
jgi:hypothetical protein